MTPRHKRFKWTPAFDRPAGEIMERRAPFEVRCTSGDCIIITKHFDRDAAERRIDALKQQRLVGEIIEQPADRAA